MALIAQTIARLVTLCVLCAVVEQMALGRSVSMIAGLLLTGVLLDMVVAIASMI